MCEHLAGFPEVDISKKGDARTRVVTATTTTPAAPAIVVIAVDREDASAAIRDPDTVPVVAPGSIRSISTTLEAKKGPHRSPLLLDS